MDVDTLGYLRPYFFKYILSVLSAIQYQVIIIL